MLYVRQGLRDEVYLSIKLLVSSQPNGKKTMVNVAHREIYQDL